MTPEQKFFERIAALGENSFPNFQIIDITDSDVCRDGEKSFRIYHGAGFCLETRKVGLADRSGDFYAYGYDFSDCECFEGFKRATVEDAIELLS